jgi:hypothetical protein
VEHFLSAPFLFRVERPARDKHSNLLRAFVNYGYKTFLTLGPGTHVIKLLMAISYDF